MRRALLEEFRAAAHARAVSVACAESDTGGLLLAVLTELAGSSSYILGGVVAYDNRLKETLLEVPSDVLTLHGAVSAEVVEYMALGVQKLCASSMGLATTGIAGPTGATAAKPLGLAYVAVALDGQVVSRMHTWRGDRAANRCSSVEAVLDLARHCLR